jgi:hypothetical protein
MKARTFTNAMIVVFALLGALSLADEWWRAPTPISLVQFLQKHGLWNLWSELRWQHMYSHEILHFLSGVVGSIAGCWIYFSLQKRNQDSK